jgi:suppressor for copper-sensitivity B
MRRGPTSLLAFLLAAIGLLDTPAAAQPPRVERAQLDVAQPPAAAPGSIVRLTAEVTIEDGWHVNAHEPSLPYLIPTELSVLVPDGWPAATVAYPASVKRTFAFEEQPLDVYEGVSRLTVLVPVPSAAGGGTYPLVVRLRYQACSDRICLPPVSTESTVTLTVSGPPAASPAPTPPPASAKQAPAATPASPAGWRFLLLAFLGGLILNAMPCVLPILSLKVFGLVRSASQGTRSLWTATLATSAGIVLSFLALALAAVLARRAGSSVGWGIQFQEPRFVGFLAVVVVLFCLNLWGLFEIQLPALLRRRLDSGQPAQEGVAGHFTSGLFATLMATPCSAPFLGTAVGFALTQPAATVFAVFSAIGLGMASPYLLLALFPGLAAKFPRPGAWMETLKGSMGFLLAGAAVWLFYVLAGQVPAERLAFSQLLTLALALTLWLAHRSRRPAARGIWSLLAVAAAISAVVVLGPGGGRASAEPVEAAAGDGAVRLPWQPWAPGLAEQLASEGRTVFVDVTADWCFTCKVNERLVLDTEPIVAGFAARGVIALKADWTNRDDRIATYLASFGKYGIPFYAVYRPGETPRVLPEVLTRELVLDSLGTAPRSQP